MKIHGTKIVRNGDPNADDVRWGPVFRILAWVGGLLAVVISGLVTAGVLRLFAMSAAIERIEDRAIAIEWKADAAASAAGAVKKELDDREKLDDQQHAGFLTKDEFYHYMSPEIRRPRRDP
jgi:hypothetical protein